MGYNEKGKPHIWVLIIFITGYMVYFITSNVYTPVGYTYLGNISNIEYLKGYKSNSSENGTKLTFTNGTQLTVQSTNIKYVKGTSKTVDGVFIEKNVRGYKLYQNISGLDSVKNNIIILVDESANRGKKRSKLLNDYLTLRGVNKGVTGVENSALDSIDKYNLTNNKSVTEGVLVFSLWMLCYLMLELLLSSTFYKEFRKKLIRKLGDTFGKIKSKRKVTEKSKKE